MLCSPTLDHPKVEFSAFITAASWGRPREFVVRLALDCLSHRVDEPRCSICAKPPAFPGHLQGSGTNVRSGTRLGSVR